jgi:hypothetical protein
MTQYVIDVPHRQYMEALRDALQLWLTDPSHGGGLAPTHPMREFIQDQHDAIERAFVAAHA